MRGRLASLQTGQLERFNPDDLETLCELMQFCGGPMPVCGMRNFYIAIILENRRGLYDRAA